MLNNQEKSLFSSRAEKGTCSHAYIVDGDKGVGKLDFALYCARAVLCDGNKKPCGYCAHCRKAINGDHPDIFIIGKDKAASIADVRELIHRSTLKPNDGDKQVFIVCNAGKLAEGSQNALLKIIEEPPQSVVIFLLTESRSSLLPTVLSRGQRIHLDGMGDEEISRLLREKYPDLSRSDEARALAAGRGNYGRAEKYLAKESVNLRTKAEAMLNHVINRDEYELINMLVVPKYRREQLRPILEAFLTAVTDIQKEKYGVKGVYALNSPQIGKLNKKSLALMGEVAFTCMMALDNNANVAAATTKMIIDLVQSATK